MYKILSGKFKKLVFISSAFILFNAVNASTIAESISGKPIDDATIAAGKTVFEGKCQSCHAIDNKLVGPALKDIHKRRTYDWLTKWIRNNEALRKSGDKDAIDVFEKNNKLVMTNFNDLKDDQLASLIMYIEDASAGGDKKNTGPVIDGPKIEDDPALVSRVNWILILLFVLVSVILFMIVKILDQVSAIRGKDIIKWNSVNGWICLGFIIIAFIACIWEFMVHGKMVLPEAATEHGRRLDQMFNITLIFTGIVFVITEFLLFYFAFKYRGRAGTKAYHYSHNNKVEAIWTIIPAIVLTVLVVGGLKTWRSITNNPERGKFNIEIFAFQFGWTGRYPGADGQLGKTNWNLISDNNLLGVANKEKAESLIPKLQQDSTTYDSIIKYMLPNQLEEFKTSLGGLVGDERKNMLRKISDIEDGTAKADLLMKIRNRTIQIGRIKASLEESVVKEMYDNTGLDDIIVDNEIHIPVNKTVTFKLRSRDVLHSAYIPMFRSQINVVPGLGTEIVFKAIETTKEKQAKLNRPDFEYWLLCAKNCGAGHFSMKLKIVVDSQADYDKWIKAQANSMIAKPDEPSKEGVKKDSTTKG